MGMLIPSPDDQDIIKKLNKRFNEHNLKKLRKFQNDNNDRIFGPGRTLRRICHRLKIFPTHSPGDRPKARWFKFLISYLPTSVHEDIRRKLDSALADPLVAFVDFDAARNQDNSPTYRLVPRIAYRAGAVGAQLTLEVPSEMPPGDSGDPTPPPTEPGEPGVDPDLPTSGGTTVASAAGGAPTAQAAKRKKLAKKKAVKKPAKKKAAKKKAAKKSAKAKSRSKSAGKRGKKKA